MNQFVAYKNLLAMNFDYFNSLFKFQQTNRSSESVLDLGLKFGSVELCYNLVVGKTMMNDNISYDDAVGVLEVCNVLICKPHFVEMFVSKLVDRLDYENIEVIKQFCEELKTCDRIDRQLGDNIIMRLSYLINPTIFDSTERDVITLTIWPKKKWSVWQSTRSYPVDIGDDAEIWKNSTTLKNSYINWGSGCSIPLYPHDLMNKEYSTTKINSDEIYLGGLPLRG